MEPKELLLMLMRMRGLNANSLAMAIKQEALQPQLFRFVTGKTKEPRRTTLQPVADYFKIPLNAFYDENEADSAWAVVQAGMTKQKAIDPIKSAIEAPATVGNYSSEIITIAKWLHDLSDPLIKDSAISRCMAVVLDARNQQSEVISTPSAGSSNQSNDQPYISKNLPEPFQVALENERRAKNRRA